MSFEDVLTPLWVFSNVLWSGGRGKINEQDGGKFGERGGGGVEIEDVCRITSRAAKTSLSLFVLRTYTTLGVFTT